MRLNNLAVRHQCRTRNLNDYLNRRTTLVCFCRLSKATQPLCLRTEMKYSICRFLLRRLGSGWTAWTLTSISRDYYLSKHCDNLC